MAKKEPTAKIFLQAQHVLLQQNWQLEYYCPPFCKNVSFMTFIWLGIQMGKQKTLCCLHYSSNYGLRWISAHSQTVKARGPATQSKQADCGSDGGKKLLCHRGSDTWSSKNVLDWSVALVWAAHSECKQAHLVQQPQPNPDSDECPIGCCSFFRPACCSENSSKVLHLSHDLINWWGLVLIKYLARGISYYGLQSLVLCISMVQYQWIHLLND